MPSIRQVYKNHRVERVTDMREHGGGLLITLKPGWTFVEGEDLRSFNYPSINAVSRNLPNDVFVYKGTKTGTLR